MSTHDLVVNALLVVAVVAISVGVGLIYLPAGVIAFGVLVLVLAFLIALFPVGGRR